MSAPGVAVASRRTDATSASAAEDERANRTLFEALLQAESEEQVDNILQRVEYFDDNTANWQPLGGFRNNFSTVGNQQADAAGAMVEKVINSIDATLMAECFARGINPESDAAPRSMSEAVERFFGVPGGRIDALTATQQTALAENIHVVATGSKQHPCYLIIDRGEGQTPAKFPTTFLGLREDNKIRIQFVQGKFHSGGTGVLQFCGRQNYQLIVSRRHPSAPTDPQDSSKEAWGFTLIRRVRPSAGERISRYMYLAPGGRVPSFRADSITVLPGRRGGGQAPKSYASPLAYGTCIKLYNYEWSGKGIATIETRKQLERFLHAPCLPFRVSETRAGYHGHFFSTTVAGAWVAIAASQQSSEESSKVEQGFPADGELNLAGIGRLPYKIVVFRQGKGVGEKYLPDGVCYALNGQVHGRAPSDFISRRLDFDYLNGSLLVSVDCSEMDAAVREDWILNSRDRTRKNETDRTVLDAMTTALRAHPGLRELNARRRQAQVEGALQDDQEGAEFLQSLLNDDPTFATLLGFGTRLVTKTGPSTPTLFVGLKFPTFFRLAREPRNGLVKACPLNCTVVVEFETDAVNDYFTRADSPGRIQIAPADLCEASHLWDGRFAARFRVPWDAKPGDKMTVSIVVTDVEREAVDAPFKCTFTLQVAPEEVRVAQHGKPAVKRTPRTSGNTTAPASELPRIIPVRRDQWEQQQPPFTPHTSLRIRHSGEGGYDFFVNVDNTFLLTELVRTDESDKTLVRFWFEWGLTFCALGVLREQKRRQEAGLANFAKGADEATNRGNRGDQDLEGIGIFCDGVGRVIVPVIRRLYRGPGQTIR